MSKPSKSLTSDKLSASNFFTLKSITTHLTALINCFFILIGFYVQNSKVRFPKSSLNQELPSPPVPLSTLPSSPSPNTSHNLSWCMPIDSARHHQNFIRFQTYLPSETPAPLRQYRKEELVALRGDGTGELQEWDRIYDNAYYNDLGDPDKGIDYARPVLGGSAEYPYPRRGRTGRPPTKTDPKIKSRLPLVTSLNIYVPRDERFGHLKLSDFLVYSF